MLPRAIWSAVLRRLDFLRDVRIRPLPRPRAADRSAVPDRLGGDPMGGRIRNCGGRYLATKMGSAITTVAAVRIVGRRVPNHRAGAVRRDSLCRPCRDW